LFAILQLVFSGQPVAQLREAVLKGGVQEQHYNNFLVYSAAFFNNCGNYKSFGGTKFIPDIEEPVFFKIISLSSNYQQFREIIDKIWDTIRPLIF
jgi:dipeptidyl-peptidase-3